MKEEVAAAYKGLELDCGPPSPFFGDMVTIFRGLHIVDNNSPHSKGGGGHPRRPPAPPICAVFADSQSQRLRLKTTDYRDGDEHEAEPGHHGCNGDPLANATQVCTCLGASQGTGVDSGGDSLPPCAGCG